MNSWIFSRTKEVEIVNSIIPQSREIENKIFIWIFHNSKWKFFQFHSMWNYFFQNCLSFFIITNLHPMIINCWFYLICSIKSLFPSHFPPIFSPFIFFRIFSIPSVQNPIFIYFNSRKSYPRISFSHFNILQCWRLSLCSVSAPLCGYFP